MEVKKILKKFIIIFIAAIISLFFIMQLMLGEDDDTKIQYLKNIDYDVTADINGDVKVVETWDLLIKNTNTLFKTFKIDKSKYSSIKDVKVEEITDNGNVPLKPINYEMYYVDKDYYYALEIDNSTFEIAWGIGMDNDTGSRKYQISYVIEDAITDYRDCQELYWSFLEEGENAIPAEKVTGTVTLPKDIQNKSDLKVWGHGQLNGEIKTVSNNQVKFNLKELNARSRLEIRVVTQEKIFNVEESNKIKDRTEMLTILEEEKKWAEEANEKRKNADKAKLIILIIYLAIIAIYIIKIIKVKKYKNKEKPKEVSIDYFRDIPREDSATPTEAVYLYKFEKKKLDTGKVQRDAVSAIILDLCLKKKINLRTDEKYNLFIKVIRRNGKFKSRRIRNI